MLVLYYMWSVIMYDENHTNWHVKYLMEKHQNVTLAPRPHTLCVDFLWNCWWAESAIYFWRLHSLVEWAKRLSCYRTWWVYSHPFHISPELSLRWTQSKTMVCSSCELVWILLLRGMHYSRWCPSFGSYLHDFPCLGFFHSIAAIGSILTHNI